MYYYNMNLFLDYLCHTELIHYTVNLSSDPRKREGPKSGGIVAKDTLKIKYVQAGGVTEVIKVGMQTFNVHLQVVVHRLLMYHSH